MDREKENGSKHSSEDQPVAQDTNGQSQQSRTESGASRHDEDGSIHSDPLSRSSSSSSSSLSSTSSSSSTPLKGSKDPNSSSDEPGISPTDSPPPVQVMDRNVPQGYDPSRIPASVFERNKSKIPAEWSCTSNESLFSIHLGNNSDLMKSGELFKSGEFVSYSPAFPLPPLTKIGPDEKTLNLAKKEVEMPKEIDKESIKREVKMPKHTEKTVDHPAVSWRSPTTSYCSNMSSNSAHSFSFPILAAGVSSESAEAEAEDLKKQRVQEPMETTSNLSRNRWLSCFPPCPWCASSCSCCS